MLINIGERTVECVTDSPPPAPPRRRATTSAAAPPSVRITMRIPAVTLRPRLSPRPRLSRPSAVASESALSSRTSELPPRCFKHHLHISFSFCLSRVFSMCARCEVFVSSRRRQILHARARARGQILHRARDARVDKYFIMKYLSGQILQDEVFVHKIKYARG